MGECCFSLDLRTITPTGARRAQDWMSRFQAYEGGLIDEAFIGDELVRMVARCMDTMDLWYGSALMMIWMLTLGPPKSRDYFTRGWCVARADALSSESTCKPASRT